MNSNYIVKKITILSVILMFLIPISFTKKSIDVCADFSSATSSEIVMESSTQRILYENNAYEKKYIASTTKILTAIVIIENCNLNEIIKITPATVGVEGSSIYLQAGEELTVKDLLYGLMLRSGNDCAETLAVHCCNSIEKFAELMNETACKIGAKNSHFVTPHGLHNNNHYSTAYDLAIISCYALKNQIFKEIVSTQKKVIPFTTENTKRVLINKNKMLKEFDGTTGIKTGYTKKAGRCLVTSCERDGMELVSVVLNCPPMFERSKTLLQNSFNEYSLYNVVESDNIIDFIPIDGENETKAVHVKQDIVIPLTEIEYKNISVVYDLPKNIDKKIKSDEIIGEVKIYCKNNLIFTQKIFTI